VRSGVRLGVDVGRARVGLAASDPSGYLASPVETIRLPLSLSGADTPSTADAREMAGRLASRTSLPVRMIDERLSTVSAQSALHATGRTTRGSRSVIDQVAAVILLQHALDSERSGGRPSGGLVDPT
jgi:putative Holliday junction resolvase